MQLTLFFVLTVSLHMPYQTKQEAPETPQSHPVASLWHNASAGFANVHKASAGSK